MPESADTGASAATLDLPPDKGDFYQGASGEGPTGPLPGPCAGMAVEEGAGKPTTGHVRRQWWSSAGGCLMAGSVLFSSPADQAIEHSNPIATTICVEAEMSEVGGLSDDPTLTGFIAVKIRRQVLATKKIPRSAFIRRQRPIRLGLDDEFHQIIEA